MKLIQLTALVTLTTLWTVSPVRADPPHSTVRAVSELSAVWKHIREDVAGAEAPGFDDAGWRDVTLPHSFNGADGDDGGGYYRGVAWYRRTLVLSAQPRERRVVMQFDGAATATTLWVNGREIGRHDGGHATFRFDVTDALVAGENRIAVRVDNRKVPTITPMGGDFTLSGGLYRPVWLIETAPVAIDLLDHGGPGVAVTARDIEDAQATVDARVRVRNGGSRRAPAEVVTTIRDADGRVVATGTRRATIGANAVETVTGSLTIRNPRRWDGRRDPHRYAVTTEVRVGGTLVDDVTVPLGIRIIAFDASGFKLNGRSMQLHGVNLFHAGRPGRGLAATEDEIRADVRTFADMGVNSLRLVHFQHPEAAYDEADRLGLLIYTEIGVNSEIADSPAFTANVEQQMRELIRQNVNHPSVVLWGIGNEVYSTEPAVTRLLQAANATAHAEDPTRPTIYAHCCQGDDDPKALVSDVIGYNRYYGWYDENVNGMGPWLRSIPQRFPGRPFIVSEYGAGASIRHQEDPPRRYATDAPFHPEQVQTRHHEINWRLMRDAPGLAGAFIWVGIDLASDGRDEGDRAGINDKGLVTYDRMVRKDAYYWYQANWSEVPMLHLVGRRNDRRTEDAIEVRAYTNGGPATLTVNGRAVGQATADDHVLHWASVPLAIGDNLVEVRAADGGLSDRMTIRRGPASALLDPDAPRVPPPPPEPDQPPPAAPPGAPPGSP